MTFYTYFYDINIEILMKYVMLSSVNIYMIRKKQRLRI
jgi:hypothetical protein